ncbi:hypothetical protein LXL04_021100 [Taraxacum kok-saghyz]
MFELCLLCCDTCMTSRNPQTFPPNSWFGEHQKHQNLPKNLKSKPQNPKTQTQKTYKLSKLQLEVISFIESIIYKPSMAFNKLCHIAIIRWNKDNRMKINPTLAFSSKTIEKFEKRSKSKEGSRF